MELHGLDLLGHTEYDKINAENFTSPNRIDKISNGAVRN